MSRPRLLDLFCGAGGCSVGYSRAGFEVVGVDNRPQPRYPFLFVQADAVETLRRMVEAGLPVTFGRRNRLRLVDFAAVHASPPCQAFSRAGKLREAQGGTSKSGDLVEPIRRLLTRTVLPWVIENVEGAPLSGFSATLCGSAFGLGVRRHRLFECSHLLMGSECNHRRQGRPVGVYHRMGDSIPCGGRTARTLEEGRAAMGIDWMVWDELKEAIPPAYTEHVGRQLLDALAD